MRVVPSPRGVQTRSLALRPVAEARGTRFAKVIVGLAPCEPQKLLRWPGYPRTVSVPLAPAREVDFCQSVPVCGWNK